METVSKVLGNTKNGWDKIDKKKRFTLVGLVAIVLIVAIGLSFFNSKLEYATLFSNLELEDAGNISEDLKVKKIAYKLENGGRDILIDKNQVDSYRLQLAMDGNMPEKSTGFEIFDNMGMMTTDEDRKIMYQRALTGELQRSIMSLDAVNTAKVHLVISEKSIFDTAAREASASIFLDLNSNRKITDDMIRGIAALVSGAVENLPEKNIKVIDSKGNLLSGFLEEKDGLAGLGSIDQFQKMQDSFEKKMEASIYEILGTALGRDKVKVSVFADLDFDAEETTTISYRDPVIRSEQVSGGGGGIFSPGDSGNIGDNDSSVIGGSGDLGQIYERITNNELTTETKTTIKAPGKINKMTTSVIYDGNLSIETSDKVLSIVAAATGYNADRGDFISIEDIAFDKSYEEQIKKDLEEVGGKGDTERSFFEKYRSYIIVGGISLLLTILILVVASRIVSKKKGKGNQVEEQFPLYMPVEQAERKVEEVEKLEMKVDPKESKAKDYAKENPEVAADMIRAWIKD